MSTHSLSLFTGHAWQRWQGQLPLAASQALEALSPHQQEQCMLVPAFVDLQIYGGGGRLFSQYPESESLAALAAENRQGGTATCLATVATQPLEIIHACIDAYHAYMQQGGQGIAGLHLEGPYMNPEKRGAHVLEWIHPPTSAEVKELLAHAQGCIKIMTIAPECCSPQVLNLLLDGGVRLSAGHSMATLQQAQAFADAGGTLVTHLFNAMSPLHHREPGLPAAALGDAGLMASIIPDGIHVHYQMVQLASRLMGERLFWITDAVTPTQQGAYAHVFAGTHYALPNGTLSGSALTMLQAVKNGIEHASISPALSLRMAAAIPAGILQMQAQYGYHGPQTPMLLLDPNWQLLAHLGW